MSVSSLTNRREFVGNGTQTVFPYAPRVFDASDLVIYVNGVLKSEGSDYGVSGVDDVSGGNVTFFVAPAADAEILIYSSPQATQPIDYTSNDPFPAETHERGLDRNTMISQSIMDTLKRAPVLAASEAYGFSQINLPHPDDLTLSTAGNSKVLRWNAAENNLDLVEVGTEVGLVSDTISAVLRANLPAAGAAGKLRLLTDSFKGIMVDNGSRWRSVGEEMHNVQGLATGGTGTSGDPYTGWEAGVNALPIGARIYFPAATYLQTQSITMKEQWVIYGDACRSSVINLDGAFIGWSYSGTIPANTNIYMHDLIFDGDGADSLSLVAFQGAYDVTIERCYFLDSTIAGLYFNECIQVTIHHCFAINNLVAGMALGDTSYCNDFAVIDCSFNNPGADNLVINEGSAGYVGRSAFEGGERGIVLNNVGFTRIINNFIELLDDNPIAATATCSNIEIAYNHLHNLMFTRLDINFGGAFAHEGIHVHHNTHVVFGGTHFGGTTFFDPGGSLAYDFHDALFLPESNRTLIAHTHVAGYARSDLASFIANVRLRRFPDAYEGTILLTTSGAKNPFVSLARSGDDLEITTAIAGSLLTITNGTQVTEFGNDITSFQNGDVTIDGSGNMTLAGNVLSDGVLRGDNLQVRNAVAAVTPGTVTNKIEVFDGAGASLGFLAVYDAIT